MIDIDPRLLRDIELAEDAKHVTGTYFVAYKDTRGFWTIGYGHLLDQSIDWTGHTISQSTADGLLAADIVERGEQPASLLPEWGALDTPCRRNALTECVFNLGIKHWTTEFPKTRASLQAGSWAIAAANLLHSPEWIREVGLKRVARLAGYFQDGSYLL